MVFLIFKYWRSFLLGRNLLCCNLKSILRAWSHSQGCKLMLHMYYCKMIVHLLHINKWALNYGGNYGNMQFHFPLHVRGSNLFISGTDHLDNDYLVSDLYLPSMRIINSIHLALLINFSTMYHADLRRYPFAFRYIFEEIRKV